MKSGHIIIFPSVFGDIAAEPKYQKFAALVMHWICEQLNLKYAPAQIHFEVITVNYHGKYPAIGAGGDIVPDDIERIVQPEIDALLAQTPISALIQSVRAAGDVADQW